MFSQKVTVTYVDGTVKDVVLDQWSISAFAQFAQSKGWKINPADPGLMAIPMLRYQTYAVIHRDPNMAKPAFERWDITVADVTPEETPEEADPTQKASGDSSESSLSSLESHRASSGPKARAI